MGSAASRGEVVLEEEYYHDGNNGSVIDYDINDKSFAYQKHSFW